MRQAVAVGERDQLGLDQALLVEAVALDLDIELVAEGVLQNVEARLRQIAAGRRRAGRVSSGPVRPPVSAISPSQWADRTGAATRGASPSGTPK